MRVIATEKAHQNRAVLDPWSVVHFATGLAAGLARVDRTVAIGTAILYEFVEQDLERRQIGQDLFKVQGPESLPNAIADVALFAAGHLLGEIWNRTSPEARGANAKSDSARARRARRRDGS
ncbi:MAG: hypothetical protein RQ745_07390 [Longimicrobiales bacterium]|nr:hypothetical protein [Longimicrobiales bacterium]